MFWILRENGEAIIELLFASKRLPCSEVYKLCVSVHLRNSKRTMEL